MQTGNDVQRWLIGKSDEDWINRMMQGEICEFPFLLRALLARGEKTYHRVVQLLLPYFEIVDLTDQRSPERILLSLLKKAQQRHFDLAPLLELIFSDAVRRRRESDVPIDREAIENSRDDCGQRTGGMHRLSLEKGRTLPEFTDDDDETEEIALEGKMLVERSYSGNILLETAALLGAPSLVFALEKAKSSDLEVRDAAYLLICHSPSLTEKELTPLLSDVDFATTMFDVFRKRPEIIQPQGTFLRSAILQAARLHPRLRANIARMYDWLEMGRYAKHISHFIATEVLLFLLEFDDCREQLTASIYNHYPHVIPVAATKLAESSLCAPLSDLLAGYGEAAIPSLLSALESEKTAHAAGDVLVRIGVSAVRPLIAHVRLKPQCAAEVERILLQLGTPAKQELLAALSELTPSARKTVPPQLWSALCQVKDAPELVAHLDDDLQRETAMRLLLAIGAPAIPALQKRLSSAPRCAAAAEILLNFGSVGYAAWRESASAAVIEEVLQSVLHAPQLGLETLVAASATIELRSDHGALLAAAITCSAPMVIAALRDLPDDKLWEHPCAQVLVDFADPGIARKLMLSIDPRTAGVRRKLLTRIGNTALVQIQALFRSPRRDIRREGELLVELLELPAKRKFPWLASLFPGADEELRCSLLKLIAPMGLPQSASIFALELQNGSSEACKQLALKGLSRLPKESLHQLLPTLCRLIASSGDHICQQAAELVGSLGSDGRAACSAIDNRRRRTRRSSQLHKSLTRALEEVN